MRAVIIATAAVSVIGFSPVAAQELPTIPVAVCKGGGDGNGTFTATTKLGEPTETRRLTETGTLEPVTTAEPLVIDLPQLSAAFVSGDWPAANAKARPESAGRGIPATGTEDHPWVQARPSCWRP